MKPRTLADFTGPSRESGQEICYQRCPVCGSESWKLYVNPQTGYWFCHAGLHSAGGRVDADQPTMGRGRMLVDKLTGPAPAPGKWTDVALPAWEPLGPRASKYLHQRGLDDQLIRKLGLVETVDKMRVLVPYYGPDGAVIYWTSRSYSTLEDGPKYLAAPGRHPLYVLPGWQPVDELILVEGVFDAISVHQWTGKTTAAIGGKALPKYLERDVLALGRNGIVVLLDSDALHDSLRLKQRLSDRRQVRVVPLPCGEDPSSLGAQLREVL